MLPHCTQELNIFGPGTATEGFMCTASQTKMTTRDGNQTNIGVRKHALTLNSKEAGKYDGLQRNGNTTRGRGDWPLGILALCAGYVRNHLADQRNAHRTLGMPKPYPGHVERRASDREATRCSLLVQRAMCHLVKEHEC